MKRIGRRWLTIAALILALPTAAAPASEHLCYGAPGTTAFGRKLLVRQGYATLHDDEQKEPLWVMYRLTRAYASGTVKRTDDFRADPDLPEGMRAELSDYKAGVNRKLNRGHMCPAEDCARSKPIMSETFLLSNMVPQNAQMNSGLWAQIEKRVREYARSYGEVFVITGPLLSTMGSKRRAVPSPMGANHVAVPVGVYKIVARNSTDGMHALAFEVPNSSVKGGTNEMPRYLVSVRQVEKDTGLNFFNALPRTSQDAFEATAATELWPLPSSSTTTRAVRRRTAVKASSGK